MGATTLDVVGPARSRCVTSFRPGADERRKRRAPLQRLRCALEAAVVGLDARAPQDILTAHVAR
jgi:hypothetical protein